jgi:hypothetical protein
MGYERKKRNLTIPLTSTTGSSSAYYRPQPPSATGAVPPRSPSPPAASYFTFLSGDANDRLQSTPDAESHFSYSTTLRRHHSDGAALTSPHDFVTAVGNEATSMWKRAILAVTGQPDQDADVLPTTTTAPPNGRPPSVGALQKEEKKDTISAKFAHYSIEVCLFLHPLCIVTDMSLGSRTQWHTIEQTQYPDYYTLTYPICANNMATMNSQLQRPNRSFSNSSKPYMNLRSFCCFVEVRLSALLWEMWMTL